MTKHYCFINNLRKYSYFSAIVVGLVYNFNFLKHLLVITILVGKLKNVIILYIIN